MNALDPSYSPTKPATTAAEGVVKKAAAMATPVISALPNSLGGTVGSSLTALPVIGTVLSVAANVTDILAFRLATLNNLATLAAQTEANRARLEELIAKMKAANQLS